MTTDSSHAGTFCLVADTTGFSAGWPRGNFGLAEADGGRFPDRQATLGQALDKYLEVADLGPADL